MNDNTVTLVSPQHVLNQQAYILFYSKELSDVPNGVTKTDMPDDTVKSGARGFQRDASSSSSSSSNSSSNSSSSSSSSSGGNSGSNIDDEGEMLSPAELAAIQRTQAQAQVQARSQVALKTDAALSSSSLPPFMSETEAEENSEELLGEDNSNSMSCEIRLKKKCSWAVKPFRYTRTYLPANLRVFR